MSVCIIATQVIMVPVSLAVGARVDSVGREQIVVRVGYSAAFLFLAGVAAAGAVLFAALIPESMPERPA